MFILFWLKTKTSGKKKETLYKYSGREKAAVMIKDAGGLKCDTAALNQLHVYFHLIIASSNVAVCISLCLFE